MVQHGGVEALNSSQESVEKMVAEFQQRRDFVVQAVNGIRGMRCPTPGGAF